MILTHFRKIIEDQKGSVEFIESTVVFSLLFFMTTVLISLTLITMNKIIFKETIFSESFDVFYDKRKNIDVFSIGGDYKDIETHRKSGIIFDSLLINDSVGEINTFKRIHTTGFLRKLDLSKDIIDELSNVQINGKSLSSIVKNYKDSLTKIGEFLR